MAVNVSPSRILAYFFQLSFNLLNLKIRNLILTLDKVDPFDILKVASKDLSQPSFDQVMKLIRSINITAISHFNIPVNQRVYRARPSEEGKPFKHCKEISYPPVVNNWGRVNKPGQQFFYGCIKPPSAEDPILTVGYEMLHILKNKRHPLKEIPVNYTIGEWRVIKPLPVIPMIFDKECLRKFPEFQTTHDNYKSSSLTNKVDIEKLEFIAGEFAKEVIQNPEIDYKISVAFTEFCFKEMQGKVKSIIYPSVRSKVRGFNIALQAENMDEFIKCERVSTFTIRFEEEDILIAFDNPLSLVSEDGSFMLG